MKGIKIETKVHWERVFLTCLLLSTAIVGCAATLIIDNEETSSGYLSNVGPGGTIMMCGDEKYSDEYLRFQFERCLSMRRSHLEEVK